ncbi:MAG: transporter [Planctomycetota bacterium]
MYRPSTPRIPRPLLLGVLLALSACFSLVASAQQTARSGAAVQPGKDVLVLRQYFQYDSFNDPDVDQFRHETVLGYGITGRFTLMAHLPVVYRNFTSLPATATPANRPADDAEWGLADLTLMAQYRFWQYDSGPINTQRATVFAGLELPSGVDGFSSDSVDPFLGAAYTRIHDRHGLNLAARYQFNTGDTANPVNFSESDADAFRSEFSYLYRLAPNAYTSRSRRSWYLTQELLFRYETNRDTELLIAPGLMLEGPTYAVGLSVALPLAQDLDHRPEPELSLLLELRFLF